MKKALKITGITLASIIGLVLIVVGVAVAMVTSSGRLTKMVRKYAPEFVTCEVQLGKADLTLFKTFPNIGVDIENVALINPMPGSPSDTLANIDLKTRMAKEEHRTLNLIRIGTCGALQPDIPVDDSYVATRYAIGLDGLIYFYGKHDEVCDNAMRDAFIKQMDYPKDLPMPYAVEGSKELFDRLAEGYTQGITATAPGFYGPQGRMLRMPLAYPENNHKIEAFDYQGWRVCNFEMESSALYGLGKMMGHNCLTICVVVANRVTEQFAAEYHPYVKKLVLNTLERLSAH